ncbi:MAG: hypothetical protein PHE15_02810 [Dehalococcoidales bacterium]|nr:hypothetical protein [Dehalococcoidales bacterium]
MPVPIRLSSGGLQKHQANWEGNLSPANKGQGVVEDMIDKDAVIKVPTLSDREGITGQSCPARNKGANDVQTS